METAPSSTRYGRGSRRQRKFDGQSAVGSQRTSQRCQATDHHHHKPPNSLNALVMRSSNPPRNVALCKNLESVATGPQFPPRGRSKSKAEHPRRSEGTEGAARVWQSLRHDNEAERKFI